MNNLSEFSDFSFFLGYTIKSVYRKFYEEIDINDANLLQECDGNLVLILNNNKSISFYPYTENFTLSYVINENLDFSKLNNLTKSTFWKDKIGKKIIGVEKKIEFDKINPSGLIIYLEDNTKIKILML